MPSDADLRQAQVVPSEVEGRGEASAKARAGDGTEKKVVGKKEKQRQRVARVLIGSRSATLKVTREHHGASASGVGVGPHAIK